MPDNIADICVLAMVIISIVIALFCWVLRKFTGVKSGSETVKMYERMERRSNSIEWDCDRLYRLGVPERLDEGSEDWI